MNYYNTAIEITVFSWSSLLPIIIAIIGGIAGIVSLILQFRQNKKLENYRSRLDSKNYINKVQFDVEFDVLKQLNSVFFDMLRHINELAPPSGTTRDLPMEKDKLEKYFDDVHKEAVTSIEAARNVLYKNESFIEEDIFKNYNEIFSLCIRQEKAYARKWNFTYADEKYRVYPIFEVEQERASEIHAKHMQLIKNIRKYFKSLVIIKEDA